MMELEELRPLLDVIHRRQRGEAVREITHSLGLTESAESYISHLFHALKLLGVQVHKGPPKRTALSRSEVAEFLAWKASQAASSPSAAE